MRGEKQSETKAECVLMFSGGRDSTLAAIRLNMAGHALTLVTVSAGHLFGFDRVRRRLSELKAHLPPDTRWMRIRQPQTGGLFGAAFGRTCLPCQHDYAVAGALIAQQLRARTLGVWIRRLSGRLARAAPDRDGCPRQRAWRGGHWLGIARL